MEDKSVRINKYLSEAGICSRREADRKLEAGEITIDGVVAKPGDRVMPGQKVLVNGCSATKEEEMILLAFNKPVGIVCTAEKREKNNVIDYINYPKRIYPIGRLDKDSEGLLLLTNNGDIVNKMMRAGNYHEKEYEVIVNRPVNDSFLHGLKNGVPLVELNTTTRKCKAWQTGKKSFNIILTQGLNRQIRRMCEYFDYRVRSLKRVRIMNIELGDLPVGKYREVTKEEYEVLLKMIARSSNDSVKDRKTKAANKNSYSSNNGISKNLDKSSGRDNNKENKKNFASNSERETKNNSNQADKSSDKKSTGKRVFSVVNKNVDREPKRPKNTSDLQE